MMMKVMFAYGMCTVQLIRDDMFTVDDIAWGFAHRPRVLLYWYVYVYPLGLALFRYVVRY